MKLESLTVRHVRNLTDIHITTNPEVNIIYGENAAGKTAILESIYLLSKARSFRTPHIRDVIQHKQEDLVVSATITQNHRSVKTGIKKSHKETDIKFAGERVKAVSEQAKNVVVQTAIPDNTLLLTGSPKDRRKWIDWALFHVEHDYLQIWHEYHQALRNRNALLRKLASETEFFVWENKMASTARILGEMWRNYLVCLQQYYEQTAGDHPCGGVVFSIKKGRVSTENYLEDLQSTRQSDLKAGFTQHGPHKVDFEFKSNGKHINTVFSRGQIKLFVTMLSIAQAKLLKKEKGVEPIVLADDLTAELDKNAVNIILGLLYEDNLQLFLTTTEADTLHAKGKDFSLFHVEHGQVKKC